MSTSPVRVVVRPPNWLGDVVMALPALAAVRAHFASAHLTIAAVPSVAPVFREQTDVHPDRVLDLPSGSRAAVALLEGEGFTTGILFPNSFGSAWQFWRAGIPERWGVARSGRRLLLTRASDRGAWTSGAHQAEYYRNVVRGLGIACLPDAPPRLAATHGSDERARAILSRLGVAPDARLVGLSPGAAYGQAKQWPPDRVAAVAAALIRQHGVTCVVLGASHDRPAALAIETWLRTHAPDALPSLVNLTGRTSLGALVGVIGHTSAFLSNDSGAMHLAAAMGRPVVAVFGPTNEQATSPVGPATTVLTEPVFCRPCMLRECPIDHRCMKRISVDRVVAAMATRLGPDPS